MDGFEANTPRRMPAPARPWPPKVLMLVTDRRQCGDRSLAQIVSAAIEGGVNAVQLREKDLPADELLALARQLRGVCGERALLFINDRVDIALLSGADGVQLGERGLPVAAVRQLLPASMRVGRSVHSVDTARAAEQDGADFLIAGTIYATASHPEAEVGGLEFLQALTSRVSLPVIAIGGVTPERAADCIDAGAAGVAVVSGILASSRPETAAMNYVEHLGL
jgi:thiamine-phosphate diphosphorylase